MSRRIEVEYAKDEKKSSDVTWHSSCAIGCPPVKLLVKDFQLLLGLGQWQGPLDGFCQLQAVPATDAGLGLVVIPPTVIRMVAYIARVIPVQKAIRPAHAPQCITLPHD